MKRKTRTMLAVSCLTLGVGAVAFAVGQQQDRLGYQDTPTIPGSKWHIHDGLRPQPKVVESGTFSTQETPGKPPSDAIILFDGKDLSRWKSDDGSPAKWKIENGAMKIGGGSISTKDQIGDCQLHIEWSSPNPPSGSGQGRGNSGVLFFGRYEIQVLDSYKAPTYPDGQASAIYGSYPPLVNASRAPGEWQTYDVLFTVPRFEGGKLTKPGYFTVFHNGVAVHNHAELLGDSNYRALPKYSPHPLRGSLTLQDHGGDHNATVRYRNIWYRDLKSYDEP